MANMDTEPLVSILTPCFNGESFVHDFFDSILKQTYKKIELIFVNDGSTDATEQIALKYKEKLESRGILFKYIFQDNKGQAAALNRGLTEVTGKYITWPDSDDKLHEDNIKEKVKFLETNKDYNIVLCECALIDENGSKIGSKKRIPPKEKDDFFKDLIMEKNILFAGGAFMIRMSSFFEAIPERRIYESRGGQNWQMLLPVLYKNTCGYIGKELYSIYVRHESHSRNLKSLIDLISRCDEHEELLRNVISSINDMPQNEKEYWLRIIGKKYSRKRFIFAINQNDKSYTEKFYHSLVQNNYVTLMDTLIYYRAKNRIVLYFYKLANPIFKKIRDLRSEIND